MKRIARSRAMLIVVSVWKVWLVIKKSWLAVLICSNIVLWLIPSDVAKILSEDDDLIFEMYSLDKFIVQMIFLIVTIFIVDVS